MKRKVGKHPKTSIDTQPAGKEAQGSAERQTPLFPLAIIVVVSFTVYLNTLYNGFVYDDNGQILRNPWIRDIRHFPEIFYKSVWSFMSAPSVSNYYRPMMHVIYMINYHIFGLKPWGFHLVNVLFHAANSVLVFFLASSLQANKPASEQACKPASLQAGKLSNSPAFLAALLFAVHPIHTEAVAWAGAITDLSCTFFYLSSLFLYTRARADVRGYSYLFSLILFVFALLCKETAATLPIVLATYDLAFRRPEDRFTVYLKKYTPYYVILGMYLIVRFYALGAFSPVKVHGELTTYQLVMNVFPLFVQYLEKLLFPVDLNAFYVLHPIISVLELKGIGAIILTAAYAAVTVVAYKKNRTAFLCLMLIFIPLLPVFYIPALGESSFAERYLYLPSAGFVVLLAMFLALLRKRTARYSPAILLVAISVVGFYSFQAITRNPVWKNDLTLFTDTVKKSPDGELPNGMLGIALMGAGRFDEAIEQFRKTLTLNPSSANAYYNLGLTLSKKDLHAEAIPEFQKALALTPDDSDARRYLAEAYVKTGLPDKAEEQHLILAKSDQTPPKTYVELGIGLAKEDRFAEAIEQYKKALAVDPDYVDAHYNLGAAYANTGQMDKALEHLRRTAALQPGNAFYRNMLGITYGQKGTYTEAVEQFREAVRLAPVEPAYRKNLDRAEALKGKEGKKR